MAYTSSPYPYNYIAGQTPLYDPSGIDSPVGPVAMPQSSGGVGYGNVGPQRSYSSPYAQVNNPSGFRMTGTDAAGLLTTFGNQFNEMQRLNQQSKMMGRYVATDPKMGQRLMNASDQMEALRREVAASRPRELDLQQGAQLAAQRAARRGIGGALASSMQTSAQNQMVDAHARWRADRLADYVERTAEMNSKLGEWERAQRESIYNSMVAKGAAEDASTRGILGAVGTGFGAVAGAFAGNPVMGAAVGQMGGQALGGLMSEDYEKEARRYSNAANIRPISQYDRVGQKNRDLELRRMGIYNRRK